MRSPRRNLQQTLSSLQANARSKRRFVNSISSTKRIRPATPTNVFILLPSNIPDTLTLKFPLIAFVVYFNVVITVFLYRGTGPGRGFIPESECKGNTNFLTTKNNLKNFSEKVIFFESSIWRHFSTRMINVS